MRNSIICVITVIVLLTGYRVAPGLTIHEEKMKGRFDNPQAVTRRCLECHKETAVNFMKTSHWNWTVKQEIQGKGEQNYGKRNALSGFYTGLASNWPGCTSCHPGYGWANNDFAFGDPANVDCLICHDSTGTYKKDPLGAGMPMGFTAGKSGTPGVDLLRIAIKAAKPTRKNCGICHFYCGGGDNVKHGDLDSSLIEPNKNFDVHMGIDNLDFSCQFCHKTAQHNITGNALGVSPGGKSRVDCVKCHNWQPHRQDKINDHTTSVACQTCHIPTYAKNLPTLMAWDWSVAGEDKPEELDKNGKPTYDKKMGALKWKKTIWPEYAWFNGKAEVMMAGDIIKPDKLVRLNRPLGNIDDKTARIFPFKIHRAKQIYDKKNNYLIVPQLVGKNGYWETFDWNKAAKGGMEAVKLAYSGEYGFVETEMYVRVNHMVAPAKWALRCANCHQKKGRFDWEQLGYTNMVNSYPTEQRKAIAKQ